LECAEDSPICPIEKFGFLLEHAEGGRRTTIERLLWTDIYNKCQNKTPCLSADREFSEKT